MNTEVATYQLLFLDCITAIPCITAITKFCARVEVQSDFKHTLSTSIGILLVSDSLSVCFFPVPAVGPAVVLTEESQSGYSDPGLSDILFALL